jgi:teichuronic acid biosynthesis glycosyltransferase TuaG
MGDESKIAPVSVIIPCYKVGLFLERAVDSVLNQTIPPCEVILVDDASPDAGKTRESIQILERRINESHVGISAFSIFLEKNCGPGGARNAGWERAKQPWIAFLDADDAWHSNKIALQYECVGAHKKIDLIAHESAYIGKKFDPKSDSKIIYGCIKIKNISLEMMLISNLLPTRSVMLRREIPFRFPESNRLSEDYSLWLEIISAGYDALKMDCILAYTFRPEHSNGGYSGQLWVQERRELATLYRFYKEGNINLVMLFLVTSWSLLKFIRRLINRL